MPFNVISTKTLSGTILAHEYAHVQQAKLFGAPRPAGELMFGLVYGLEIAGRFPYYALYEGLDVRASLSKACGACSLEVAASLYAEQGESPFPSWVQALLGD